jgi:hypothetical protein
MSRALDQAQKKGYALVRFTYGDPADPTKAAYTNWTEDVNGSPVFASTSAMEIEIPANNGTLEEAELTVRLPLDSFTEAVTSGLPHSPIFVEVWDKTVPTDLADSTTTLKPFTGRVMAAVRYPDGKNNVVELTAHSYKLLLDVPLGIPATHQCQNTFTKGACQVTPDDQLSGLTISLIEGKKITVAGLRTVPAFADRNFHRGYIWRDGCWIAVREWRDTDYNVFYLVKQPPANWSGAAIKAYAGCDKTIESCRTRPVTSGEQYFMGCGFAIPDYNPIVETGQ